MSGTPNALPKAEWVKWVNDTFQPLVARIDAALATLTDRSTRNESRIAAVERVLPDVNADVAALKREHLELANRLTALERTPEPAPEPEEPEEPAPVGFADATHRVAPLVDEGFDPAAATVRTGRTLTPVEAAYHAAFTRAFYRSDPISELNIYDRFGRDDSYHIGRWGQTIQDPALLVLARTGDGRILDRLTVAWRLARDNLHVEWDASNLDATYIREWADARVENGRWVFTGDKRPWSPYPKWLYAGENGRAGSATDLNRLQTIKPWGILVEYLWALEVNRGKRSPAGIDYGAEADRWKPTLRGFIDTWSVDTDEPWARNYTGLDGGMLWDADSSRAREGTWPIFVRGEGHAIYNAALFTYYCGLLGERGWDIPNPTGALTAADELVKYIRTRLMVPSKDSSGRPSLILKGGAKNTPMNATYTGYAAMSLAAMRDIGRWNDNLLDDDTMTQIARAYDDMIRADGSTKKNLAAEIDRSGTGMDVSGGSDRSPLQTAIFGCAYALLWDETDNLLEKALAAQSAAGGLSNARAGVLPAAMFAREVGP